MFCCELPGTRKFYLAISHQAHMLDAIDEHGYSMESDHRDLAVLRSQVTSATPWAAGQILEMCLRLANQLQTVQIDCELVLRIIWKFRHVDLGEQLRTQAT